MKIVTWNMQGGTKGEYINQVIQQTGANVLCLQETGNMAPLLHETKPVPGFPNSVTGSFVAGRDFYECVFWYNNAWVQGGLAVMSNVGFVNQGIMVAVPATYVPKSPRNLPWMEVKHPYTGVIIQIYSIHSPPLWDGVTIANVCSWNNSQIASINAALSGNWAVVGDFNADPTTSGFFGPPAGVMVRGSYATQQSGGILDYSISNSGASYTFVSSSQLVGASDHYPQEFSW